ISCDLVGFVVIAVKVFKRCCRSGLLEGTYKLDDTRQTVRATVGPGEITVRNEEKQAALEQSGATAPIEELNRNPDKAYEITRDKP
ncbi:hypothetical protein ACC687_39825, partial [Rhizobium ruizarguesonis]